MRRAGLTTQRGPTSRKALTMNTPTIAARISTSYREAGRLYYSAGITTVYHQAEKIQRAIKRDRSQRKAARRSSAQ
jgi:hypothetical protein